MPPSNSIIISIFESAGRSNGSFVTVISLGCSFLSIDLSAILAIVKSEDTFNLIFLLYDKT